MNEILNLNEHVSIAHVTVFIGWAELLLGGTGVTDMQRRLAKELLEKLFAFAKVMVPRGVAQGCFENVIQDWKHVFG